MQKGAGERRASSGAAERGESRTPPGLPARARGILPPHLLDLGFPWGAALQAPARGESDGDGRAADRPRKGAALPTVGSLKTERCRSPGGLGGCRSPRLGEQEANTGVRGRDRLFSPAWESPWGDAGLPQAASLCRGHI